MSDPRAPRVCFFLNGRAKEAAEYYAAVIPECRIEALHELAPGLHLSEFSIRGAPFMTLDGNQDIEPRPDISISLQTRDQAETDALWAALSDGGQEGPCGWLHDRFGVHWQIVPADLTRMLSDPDRAAAGRAQAAMRRMKKIEIAAIEATFRGDQE